jgi:hypothetical protein
MFIKNLLAIPSGAITEVREALSHMADEITAEFEALKMRTENLEFRATGKIDSTVETVKDDIETGFTDFVVEAHHVGLTFGELVYALRHPVRAARALHDMQPLTQEEIKSVGEGRPAALEIPTATGAFPPGSAPGPNTTEVSGTD